MRISPLKLSHGSPEGKSPKRPRRCLCRSVSARGQPQGSSSGLLAQCAAVTGPEETPFPASVMSTLGLRGRVADARQVCIFPASCCTLNTLPSVRNFNF